MSVSRSVECMYGYPVYARVRLSQGESGESRDYIQKAETQTELHSKRTSGTAISRQSLDTLSRLLFASFSIPNTRDQLVSTQAPFSSASFPCRLCFSYTNSLCVCSKATTRLKWFAAAKKNLPLFLSCSLPLRSPYLALSFSHTHSLASFFLLCSLSLPPLLSLSVFV